MKIYILTLFAAVAALTSCEKNDLPQITDVEIGYDNTRTVEAGKDLHFEATITASYKVTGIRLVIHSEDHEQHVSSEISGESDLHQEWEVDKTYTGAYVNVKNTVLHEHVEVPLTAEPGIYHMYFYVTDEEGNQEIYETEIEVLPPAGV